MSLQTTLAAILLVAIVSVQIRSLRGARMRYARFKAIGHGAGRTVAFRRIVRTQILMFGLPALAGLTLLGALDTLVELPEAFWPLADRLPWFPADFIAVSFATGVTLGSLLAWLLYRWRGPRTRRVHTLGDVTTLVPRTRSELPWGALIALSAGVCEELMFRLFLPLSIAIVTGSAVIAFVGATLLFGAMHRYQGKVGVIATTVVGASLAAIYLSTHALWLAIAFHVLLDMAALVAHPLQRGVWRVSSSAATPS